MKSKKIVLLGGKGISTNVIYHYLDIHFGVFLAIVEEKEKTNVFLKRRIKKLGLLTVVGQIAFQMLAVLIRYFSKKRIAETIYQNKLNITNIPLEKIQFVISVNSKSTIDLIKEINPDLIIVNGTRILSKKVLESISCKFINMHAGITPKYRGVHGMYWALVNNDLENSGVTIHFIDCGIDTGNIIEQAQVIPTHKDNFTTYPLLQLSSGLDILGKAIMQHFTNTVIIKRGTKDSSLWYHPTILQYLYYRIFKGIK